MALPRFRPPEYASRHPRAPSLQWAPLATVALALGVLISPSPLTAQTIGELQESGPRIHTAGFTFSVENPTFAAPSDHVFKVLFELAAGDGGGSQLHPELVTVARFLNLHARHGFPDDQVHAAAVAHGGAFTALLNDEAYAARHDGRPNPSAALVRELIAAGVPLILCGQTAGARGVAVADLIPGVQVGISAMTAVNVLLAQGYHYNPW